MILVDGMMLVRRCEAKMDFLTNSNGIPTGMEFGFLRVIESVQKKLGDRDVVVCWDSKKNFKKETYETYKSNRPSKTDEFYSRLTIFKQFVSYVYPTCEERGYEADDIMGAIAEDEAEFGQVYLYTNDKDLLQVVGDNICMITSHESQLWRWDAEDVVEEFGCTPKEFVFYKVFLGDKVDNIQGIPRFPKRVLVEALAGCTSVDQVLVRLLGADLGLKTHEALQGFVRLGLAKINYDLVKLSKVDYTIKIDHDEDFVKAKLIEWEIGSLEICKDYDFRDVFSESEF